MVSWGCCQLDVGASCQCEGMTLCDLLSRYGCGSRLCCQLSMITQTWTRNMLFAVIGSIAIWFFFVIVYSALCAEVRISAVFDFCYVGINVLVTPLTWMMLPLVVVATLSFDWAWLCYWRSYSPTTADIVREWESGLGRSDERVLDSMEGLPDAPERTERSHALVSSADFVALRILRCVYVGWSTPAFCCVECFECFEQQA